MKLEWRPLLAGAGIYVVGRTVFGGKPRRKPAPERAKGTPTAPPRAEGPGPPRATGEGPSPLRATGFTHLYSGSDEQMKSRVGVPMTLQVMVADLGKPKGFEGVATFDRFTNNATYGTTLLTCNRFEFRAQWTGLDGNGLEYRFLKMGMQCDEGYGPFVGASGYVPSLQLEGSAVYLTINIMGDPVSAGTAGTATYEYEGKVIGSLTVETKSRPLDAHLFDPD